MPKAGLAFARSLATLKCLPPSRQGWLHPKTQSWYPIWGLTPNRRSGNPSSVWRMSLLQSTSRHNSPPLSCFCRDSMIWTCLPSFLFLVIGCVLELSFVFSRRYTLPCDIYTPLPGFSYFAMFETMGLRSKHCVAVFSLRPSEMRRSITVKGKKKDGAQQHRS